MLSKMLVFSLLIFALKGVLLLTILDRDLIKNYFKENDVKAATIFGCYNRQERISISKELMSQSRPLSVLKINHGQPEKALNILHGQIRVVVDGDCDFSEQFLISCGYLKLFDVKHHWLIMSSSLSIIQKFSNVALNVDADVQLAVKNSTSSWNIFDIYNPAFEMGGILYYEELGSYNQRQGYDARSTEPKYWKRKNMTGITFNTIIVLLQPFEGTLDDYVLRDDNKTADTFCRFQHKLFQFCQNYYNFTMNTQLGKSWGYPFPNGSFDGMVGALERQVIHFGSCPVFVREDRMRVISYGRNTWSWRAGFLFRIPKSRTSIEIFLKPLSTSSWLITAFLAVISILLLKTVATFEKRKHHTHVEASWSLTVIFIVGAFCQQGSPSIPKMACGRITVVSILFLSLLIYQFYSASIVSNLLMKPTNKINNLKDLLESSLKVGCEDTMYTRDLFAHTTDKVIKDLYKTKIYGKGNTSHYFVTNHGLELVKDEGYAFHVEVARAYPVIETTFSDQAVCDLREVKLFKNTDLYSTYEKNSPFYNMLETCFQKLTENGILFKEFKHWHPRKPECIHTSQSLTSFHVGLDEFFPALLILLIGIVLSLTVLVVEKYVQLVKLRTKRSVTRSESKELFPFAN